LFAPMTKNMRNNDEDKVPRIRTTCSSHASNCTCRPLRNSGAKLPPNGVLGGNAGRFC
jgi:hypothetical protein